MGLKHTIRWSWLVGLMLTAGCIEESSDGKVDAALASEAGLTDGRVADSAPDGSTGSDGGPAGDAAVQDGAVPDRGLQPDAFVGSVDSCESACDRYDSCGRTGEIFGDRQRCVDSCERRRLDREPTSWWTCLEVESCNLLHLCRVPDIQAIACERICERADTCQTELNVGDCVAECQESGAPFQGCGEHLIGVCDNAAFLDCVAQDVYPQCANYCASAIGCNLVRADGCSAECIASLTDEDPLRRARTVRRLACVGAANDDCFIQDACINSGQDVPEPVQICERWRQCGYDDFLPCEFLSDEGFDSRCVAEQLRNNCGDIELIFDRCQGGGQNNPDFVRCSDLCTAKDLCGLLDDGAGRLDCAQGCGAQVDGDQGERNRVELACGAADSCPELVDCLAINSPRARCETHCTLLDGCGLGSADCVEACDQDWPRDRHAAYRECIADADGCDAVAACELVPPFPCSAYCQTQTRCGLVQDQQACLNSCDDAQVADLVGVQRQIACTLTAGDCNRGDRFEHAVSSCRRPAGQGLECLGYCRATSLECAEGGVEIERCLVDCGAGLRGDAGLIFEAGANCLAATAADADCQAVQACLPDDANVDCEGICAAAAACGVEPANCAAACGDDELGQLRGLQASACLDGADDCDAVAACFGEELALDDVGPPNFEAFCQAYDACDLAFNFGPCESFWQDAGGDSARRCVLNELQSGCPDDIFLIFDRCFEGNVEPPIAAPCDRLCEAQARCGQREGSRAECRQRCERQLDVREPDGLVRLAPQLSCANAWSCPELSTCVEDSPPAVICAAHCANLAGCGLGGAQCQQSCDERFARDRERPYRACVAAAAGDCEAVTACAVPVIPPCDRRCGRLAECGIPIDGRCVADCDDANFQDPVSNSQSLACILAAPECDGPADGPLTVTSCLENPNAGGLQCLNFCRAELDCDLANPAFPQCMTRCVDGFRDADALRLAEAGACLEAVPADAECGVLQACIPAEGAIDCDRYCAIVDGCLEGAPGACLAACAGDAIDVNTAGCVVDAIRVGDQCRDVVVSCLELPDVEASAQCVALCEHRYECDRTFDRYLCEQACTPDPAALGVQLECALLSGCGDVLNDCLALDAEPNPECAVLCASPAGGCFVEDDAACAAICTGRDASPTTAASYPEDVAACLERIDEVGPDGVCAPPAQVSAELCFAAETCENVTPIRIGPEGGQVQINTNNQQDLFNGNCGGGGPEQAVAVTIARRSLVTFTIIEADYDPLIFLRDSCDDPESALACNDDVNGLLSQISERLEPGTYFLFVDGFAGDQGTATLEVRIGPP